MLDSVLHVYGTAQKDSLTCAGHMDLIYPLCNYTYKGINKSQSKFYFSGLLFPSFLFCAAGGKKQASKDPATNRWQQSSPPSSMQQAHRPPHLTTTLHSQPPHLHHSTQQRGSDDDGGWSRGSPAKGSGWSSKHKTHSMPARDTTKAGNQAVDWGGSPEMDSVAVWPVSEHKHQESGGSGEGDGWNTFSPGQSNCSRGHSQPENWMSDEGSLSMGDNACSPQKDPSPSPSSNTGWNVVPDVPNVQQELEPIEDDEIDEDTPDSSVDDRALQHYHNKDHDGARKSEERSRPSWDNLDSIQPITKADKEVLQFTKESSASSFSDDNQRRSSSSPGSKNTSCSPSGDLDKAVEGETSGIESDRNTFSDGRENSKESTSENASQSRDLGSGGTPDGGGLGMGVWKSHTGVGGSTSSINSIGSSSSWKSDGKNGYHSKPNFSPRKTTRCVIYTCTCIWTFAGRACTMCACAHTVYTCKYCMYIQYTLYVYTYHTLV